MRSDFQQGAELGVEIDGRPVGAVTKPPARGGFDYLEIRLTPRDAAASSARVLLRSRGAPFAPYAFWWLADASPPTRP